ncbi:MAG: hypothetical protein WD231_02960 [Candidatus Woykebacteria bacterium]
MFGINLGKPEPYWIHEIDLTVGGNLHKLVKVGFKQLGTTNFGVLGQQGFFDHYIVKFDLLKEELELKPRN